MRQRTRVGVIGGLLVSALACSSSRDPLGPSHPSSGSDAGGVAVQNWPTPQPGDVPGGPGGGGTPPGGPGGGGTPPGGPSGGPSATPTPPVTPPPPTTPTPPPERTDTFVSVEVPAASMGSLLTSGVDVASIGTVRRVVVRLHGNFNNPEISAIGLDLPGTVTAALYQDPPILGPLTGADLGVDCSATTIFDDTAAGTLDTGTPPYDDRFRSLLGFLTTLSGLSGTQVNGRWELQIAGGVGGSLGTLNCWQLEITHVP